MDIMGPAKGANGFRANGTRVKDKKVYLLCHLSVHAVYRSVPT